MSEIFTWAAAWGWLAMLIITLIYMIGSPWRKQKEPERKPAPCYGIHRTVALEKALGYEPLPAHIKHCESCEIYGIQQVEPDEYEVVPLDELLKPVPETPQPRLPDPDRRLDEILAQYPPGHPIHEKAAKFRATLAETDTTLDQAVCVHLYENTSLSTRGSARLTCTKCGYSKLRFTAKGGEI